MIVNLKKIGNWLFDRIATIILTLVVGGFVSWFVPGATVAFKEIHSIYTDFPALKRNSDLDLLAHRQIQIKDSLQALYKDSVKNQFLTIEGTLEAHTEKLIDIQSQILRAK